MPYFVYLHGFGVKGWLLKTVFFKAANGFRSFEKPGSFVSGSFIRIPGRGTLVPKDDGLYITFGLPV